jgi:hypothetical protein
MPGGDVNGPPYDPDTEIVQRLERRPEPGSRRRGFLLREKDDRKVAAQAVRWWESQNELMREREARWEVNELRRSGVPNVKLIKEEDRPLRVWVPPQYESNPIPSSPMNKAATLCRKFVSLIYADPPSPDPEPATASDEDVAAAEFTKRVLIDVQGVRKLNEKRAQRMALDKACSFGSGFIRYWVNPAAGGRRPLQISAGIGALTADDALEDPATGLDWPDYVDRYVTADGTLTNDPAEARMEDLPGIEREVLTGRQVRFMPHNAESVDQAYGMQVATFRTWGWLKKQWPDLEKLEKARDDENKSALDELFGFKPARARLIMTPTEREVHNRGMEGNRDERLVFVLTTYMKGGGSEYPDGAYVVTLGNTQVAERDVWSFEAENGELVPLPIPIAQNGGWAEGSDSPYRFGLMDIVGSANEIRSDVVNSMLDWLDKLLNRKVFVPMHSPLTQADMRLPGHSMVPIVPGGEPKYEQVPSYPQDGMNMFTIISNEMENDVSLGQIAQGLESAQVQSGRHAQAIISQVHSSLSEIRDNAIDCYLRSCHIEIMLIRAFFDAEQRIGFVGEDGAYKERYWAGTDLRYTQDVNLAAGTMTMLSPVAKSQLAEHFAQLGILRGDELKEIVTGQLGAMVGMRDDPFMMRVRRQIHAWKDGPPENWQPEMQTVLMAGPDGQPKPQQQQVMDPVMQGIFQPIPADDLPFVALIRLRELAKVMAGSRYAAKPLEWRWGIDMEFRRAMAAAAATQGQAPQPGQPAAQPSPANMSERGAPMNQPETPLPSEQGPVQVQ